MAFSSQARGSTSTTLAAQAFDEGHKALDERDVMTTLSAVRAIARVYTLSTVTHAMEGATQLGKLASTIHDMFGTGSHYSLSLVHVVASICLVVDEVPDD